MNCLKPISSIPAFGRAAALLTVLAALASAGCEAEASGKPAEHPIVHLAPFDLDCPREQLHYTQLTPTTWGVTGCGRRTKYVKVCRQVGTGIFISDDCRWIQN